MPQFDFYPSFNAGEVSPFIDARTSLEKYRSACRTLENFQILPYGGAIRRPGTEYLGPVKSPTAASAIRLVGFNFSVTTRFQIEMGDGYMRFWKPDGTLQAAASSLATAWATGVAYTKGKYVTESGTRYYCLTDHTSGATFATDLSAGKWVAQTIMEVPTPYAAADLREIQIVQVNDILYLAHESYAPSKLTRVADDNWTFGSIVWDYPPLQEQNTTDGVINVTQGGTAIPRWSAGTSYEAGDYVLPPAWVASTAYVIDDIVENGSVAYKCIQAHTSGANFAVGSDWTAQAVSGLRHYRALTTHISSGTFGSEVGAGKFSSTPLPLNRIGRHIITAPANTFNSALVGQQMELKWPTSFTGFGSNGVSATGSSADINVPITSDNISSPMELEGEWDLITNGKWSAGIQVLRVDQQKTGLVVANGTRSGSTVTVYHPSHGWSNGDAIAVGGEPGIASVPYYTKEANITVTGANSYTYTTSDSTNTGTRPIYPVNLTKAEVVAEFTRDTDDGGDSNIIYTGNQLKQATFFIRVINWLGSTNTPGTPLARLQPRNPVNGGFATIIEILSGSQAVIRVDSYLGRNRHHLQANTKLWSLPAFYSGNYPRAVAMHEQRIFWAGTSRQPTTLWGSEIDNFETFKVGANASDSIKITLAASEGNRITWMQSQQNSLLLGTTGDEWTISAADVASSLSATNLEAKRQSSYGSKYMRSVIVNDVLLFIQRNGRKVRELVYELNKDGWVAPDLTLLAEHITAGEITEIAYQQQPDAVLWCVRGDGALIAMTYERDQKVVGWHRHLIADAEVESVSTIYGNGTEDEVWMVVKRTISASPYRTIERFPLLWRENFDDSSSADYRYLDSFETFAAGAAGRTVSGLDHLEGKTVTIVQGSATSTATVSSGDITVPETDAGYLGLPYTSTLRPMKLDASYPDGSAQGRKKRIHQIVVRTLKSRGGEVRTNNGSYFALNPAITTGDQRLILGGAFGLDADVDVRVTSPDPFCCIAILPKWDTYGNE